MDKLTKEDCIDLLQIVMTYPGFNGGQVERIAQLKSKLKAMIEAPDNSKPDKET